MFNTVWQVALKPGTTKMQDVILADLEINDLDTISLLLATNHLKGEAIKTERGNYLLMYGGEYRRPYHSIMIWRFEKINDKGITYAICPDAYIALDDILPDAIEYGLREVFGHANKLED